MAVCERCGASFAYADGHVCGGRDRGRLWAIASVAVGVALGAIAGLRAARLMIADACGRPDAGNLCGLVPSYFVPGVVVIGAVAGACAATIATLAVVRMRA